MEKTVVISKVLHKQEANDDDCYLWTSGEVFWATRCLHARVGPIHPQDVDAPTSNIRNGHLMLPGLWT